MAINKNPAHPTSGTHTFRDSTGALWTINMDTGAAHRATRVEIHDAQMVAQSQNRHLYQLNYAYHPGQAVGNYTSYAKDAQSGSIYGVTAGGEYQYLNGKAYAQLAHPRYTSYGFNPEQRSAFDLMNKTLQSWGLGTLSNDLRGLILKGDTNADTLSLALSQTDAYKKRFAANAERIKKGLPELTPAQYIATEEQYRNVLASYGLPKGFYDQQQDLDKFIANDTSPTELDARAKIAAQQFQNAPQAYKDVWQQYYGLTKGDAIASIIDPNHSSLQDITNQANSVGIGATAKQEGLNVSQQRAEQFTSNGVTLSQAQKAYQQIAQSLPLDQQIAHRFGTTFGQTQEENDLLLNQGSATALRQQLYGEEQGLFKAHAGATAESLGVQQNYGD